MRASLRRDGAAEVVRPQTEPESMETALIAFRAALEKKALEPLLLDVRALCSYADYILLVSGRSDRQVGAIADAVQEAAVARGRRPLGVEGLGAGQWTLVDFGDVIVHVFHHPTREFYDLEGLWIDAPRVALEVPPEARASPEDVYSE